MQTKKIGRWAPIDRPRKKKEFRGNNEHSAAMELQTESGEGIQSFQCSEGNWQVIPDIWIYQIFIQRWSFSHSFAFLFLCFFWCLFLAFSFLLLSFDKVGIDHITKLYSLKSLKLNSGRCDLYLTISLFFFLFCFGYFFYSFFFFFFCFCFCFCSLSLTPFLLLFKWQSGNWTYHKIENKRFLKLKSGRFDLFFFIFFFSVPFFCFFPLLFFFCSF